MDVVNTTTKFCYIECDRKHCSKKMYHFHEKILKQFAMLYGWENKGDLWICPKCVEKSRRRQERSQKSRQKSVAGFTK